MLKQPESYPPSQDDAPRLGWGDKGVVAYVDAVFILYQRRRKMIAKRGERQRNERAINDESAALGVKAITRSSVFLGTVSAAESLAVRDRASLPNLPPAHNALVKRAD